jgi:hypothetical protein
MTTFSLQLGDKDTSRYEIIFHIEYLPKSKFRLRPFGWSETREPTTQHRIFSSGSVGDAARKLYLNSLDYSVHNVMDNDRPVSFVTDLADLSHEGRIELVARPVPKCVRRAVIKASRDPREVLPDI